MRRLPRPFVVRDTEGGETLETLLVFAVTTVIAIRVFLKVTGYPQLGLGGLHIAHMLWGGLLMLIALGVLLAFWNPGMRRLAACVGGIGFGFFIDELGKFITRDNDYFFEPTVAVLYVLFLGLFLIVRWIQEDMPEHGEEERINRELRALVAPKHHGAVAGTFLGHYLRVRYGLAHFYRKLASRPWFELAVTVMFVGLALVSLGYAVYAFVLWRRGSFDVAVVPVLAGLLSSLCMWVGAVRLTRSRLSAYIWFRRGVAMTLLFGQVVQFYQAQFSALWGLAGNLLLYLALGYMIDREQASRTSVSRPAGRGISTVPAAVQSMERKTRDRRDE